MKKKKRHVGATCIHMIIVYPIILGTCMASIKLSAQKEGGSFLEVLVLVCVFLKWPFRGSGEGVSLGLPMQLLIFLPYFQGELQIEDPLLSEVSLSLPVGCAPLSGSQILPRIIGRLLFSGPQECGRKEQQTGQSVGLVPWRTGIQWDTGGAWCREASTRVGRDTRDFGDGGNGGQCALI